MNRGISWRLQSSESRHLVLATTRCWHWTLRRPPRATILASSQITYIRVTIPSLQLKHLQTIKDRLICRKWTKASSYLSLRRPNRNICVGPTLSSPASSVKIRSTPTHYYHPALSVCVIMQKSLKRSSNFRSHLHSLVYTRWIKILKCRGLMTSAKKRIFRSVRKSTISIG